MIRVCLIALSLLCFCPSFTQNLERCAFAKELSADRNKRPEVVARMQAIERFTQNWIEENYSAGFYRQVYSIPVVIHVVWNTSDQNISEEKIFEQIEILNADYRAVNKERDQVEAPFDAYVADTQIEFCLATVDPEGQATNGITRTFTVEERIGQTRKIYHAEQGGADAWDPEHYLNIWIGDLGGTLGFGSAPGQRPPAEDGVLIDYRFWGYSPDLHANLGRTATHEIGHYFNLQHLWGETFDDCNDDDGVPDTPVQYGTYDHKCPVGRSLSCGSLDMYMNFMNYTDDACMALFSTGQKLRMLATLHGPRAGLLESQGCEMPSGPAQKNGISLFPNPADEQLYFTIQDEVLINETIFITLVDMSGRLLYQNSELASSGFFHHNINIHHFPAGVYALKIHYSNEDHVYKVLVR